MPRFVKLDRSAAIGTRICIARITAGLSLPALADGLRISHQQLYKYERGLSRLPAVMLDDLGRLTGRTALFSIATDEAALTRAALMQRPDHHRVRRRFDRALDVLKVFAADERSDAQGADDGRLSA